MMSYDELRDITRVYWGRMALEIRQTQKLAQKLVLTQQLQQAIELLVLNSQELVEAVNKELLENPALEEVPGSRNEQYSEAENRLQQEAAKPGKDAQEQSNGTQEEAGLDWNRVLEERRKGDGSRSMASARRVGLGPYTVWARPIIRLRRGLRITLPWIGYPSMFLWFLVSRNRFLVSRSRFLVSRNRFLVSRNQSWYQIQAFPDLC